MKITAFDEIIEPNDQTEARHVHLEKLRTLVGNVYPNKFERSKVSGEEDTITNLVKFAPVAEIVRQLKDNTPEGAKPDQELKAKLNEKLKEFGNVRISGRLAVPPRVMGKAAFVHLSDGIERLQIYVRRDDVQGVFNGKSEPSAVVDGLTSASETSKNNLQPPATADGSDTEVQPPVQADGSETVNGWELFALLDHGDFIGAEGFLFLTNTGELSVHVEKLQFLSKALLPMPDKMHGIADPELQRRYRYADLIASSLQIEHEGLTTREVFERRAKLISGMRQFLDSHGYIEVETPMLTPKATGAAATPFETHHNALDIPLYARIAPELYLKRLTVGGFEKVYELNRNFRNEGLSHKHNPEFTMLEFYCAYMDVNGMMDFCEEMLKESVQKATGGSLVVNYDGKEIDFSKFERISMKEAIIRHLPKVENESVDETWFDDSEKLHLLYWIAITSGLKEGNVGEEAKPMTPEVVWSLSRQGYESAKNRGENSADSPNAIVIIFEELVEENLIQPTFIVDYPKSISPLSKASPENPQIAERFELFINGMECANGFSELNDPREQYERFTDQMKERESGDHEAMVLDEDYIRALAYGMPPAAGIGIGIDRLVMLLTNKHSIRDVILFPHMRPVSREEGEKGSEGEEE
jgi:lysyl-tRNA synthetase class 2